MIALSCPRCGGTFTRTPKSRAMTPERVALILRALKVGRQTVRAMCKRGWPT